MKTQAQQIETHPGRKAQAMKHPPLRRFLNALDFLRGRQPKARFKVERYWIFATFDYCRQTEEADRIECKRRIENLPGVDVCVIYPHRFWVYRDGAYGWDEIEPLVLKEIEMLLSVAQEGAQKP